MCRIARIKKPNYIYHIMCRTISEIDLFKDNTDKNKFINYIKKYKEIFDFKVYSYCLMPNHVHLLIYANGADISKFMHGINQSYAQYFNKRYQRHGHVFQNRFKSKVVMEEDYLKMISFYIHNNPRSIEEYNDRPYKYEYSSLAVFLGYKEDQYGILDEMFMLSLFGDNLVEARRNYGSIMNCEVNSILVRNIDFDIERYEYRSDKVVLARNVDSKKIVKIIKLILNDKKVDLFKKYRRESTEYKAIFIALIRYFSDFTYKDICKIIGNITSNRVAQLASIGFKLISSEEKYSKIIKECKSQIIA